MSIHWSRLLIGMLWGCQVASAGVADIEKVAEKKRHWALQPLSEERSSATLDSFILTRLAKDGLSPSAEADRPTLLRRLSFDLIGLPPLPEEIDAFVNDGSPKAFETVVERLLASPHYGERWGRHWLDVARYTESNGFEYDRLRPNAWHYRDYVIKSFNDDKPYDRFVKEQIAGDVLESVTSEGIIAASFLVCGPWDAASAIQANPTQKLIAREDELEDIVAAVGQTFMGLTVNCARCHDHKFDAISQVEYYRIRSVVSGVKHGERAAGDIPASYVGTRVESEPTRFLKRGEVTSPQEVVTPGALAAVVGLNADFEIPANAPEAQRRLKFADWLADARNPLTARVMVNRVWHYHFGQGLVATPNDLGVNGARPSHSELLDWLSVKFIDSGWSVKALHRLIVNSATYRQGSEGNDKAASLDADNLLLWRFSPHRLEGEAVRDAMLAVSGQLNPAMGGPSFQPFTITEFNAAFYHLFDRGDPEFNRRTVYRINVNSGKDPLLDAFDCPDPSVKTPRRGMTTTPLQALELMNNSFVLRQARMLGERALAACNHEAGAAISMIYRLALGRLPNAEETLRAEKAVQERSLTSLCWALLNSTEFVYVR